MNDSSLEEVKSECSESESDTDYYVVEEILQKRSAGKGHYEYKVKWQGYTIEEATWEPELNLSNVDDMVVAFNTAPPKPRKPRKKKGPTPSTGTNSITIPAVNRRLKKLESAAISTTPPLP